MALSERFLRSVTVPAGVDAASYPFSIPAIARLGTLDLDAPVVFFVGKNGSGKSTLVEALAVAAGFNPEGGSRNFAFATRTSHSELHDSLVLRPGVRRPRDGFFLRAESFYNVATQVDELYADDPGKRALSYGQASLHEQSHGESFLSLVLHRFRGNGLYVLDEPEAALSLRGQLALLRRMHDLVGESSQFVVATHSPILLAYPGALIYELAEDGACRRAYEETDQYELTRSFLDGPERFLRHLFAD